MGMGCEMHNSEEWEGLEVDLQAQIEGNQEIRGSGGGREFGNEGSTS